MKGHPIVMGTPYIDRSDNGREGSITSTTSNTADVAGKVKACVRSPNASQDSIASGALDAAKAANDAKAATQLTADSSDGRLGARANQFSTVVPNRSKE